MTTTALMLATLIAALSGSALASPMPPTRRLQKSLPALPGGVDAATLAGAITQYGTDLVSDVTAQVAQNQATGSNSLWFRSFNGVGSSFARCGEIDAAPYMPSDLFQPRHFLNLLAYAEATVMLYRAPVSLRGEAVELGRCSGAGYTDCYGGVQGIAWLPGSLMGPVCGERCGCNYNGACTRAGNFPGIPSCENLPTCRDVPDDPDAGEFCSLCSPSTACPGCNAGNTVVVGLCYEPQGPSPPPASPPPPPPAPPPPPVLPNDGNHLYFYFINEAFDRCGDVDAAPLVPEGFFEPQNILALAAYVQATTSLYSVQFGGGFQRSTTVTVQQGRCADVGYTIAGTGVSAGPARPGENNKAATAVASWTPNSLMGPACSAQCGCAWPTRSNAYPQPGDPPLCGSSDDRSGGTDGAGPYCSLCGSAACPINPGGCGQQGFGIGDGVNIDLFYQPCRAGSSSSPRGCVQPSGY